jgi:4a-hydroxytetrahydrobiopterin dehydratase
MGGLIALETNLGFKTCRPHKKGERSLKIEFIKGYLSQLSGWKLSGKEIVKLFEFKNIYETIGFVNAVAYIANQEDHHQDLEVGYKTCKVRYSSHDVGGLSENDFICATKIEELFTGIS